MTRFIQFLESLRTRENIDVLNAITCGYEAIYEVLSNDDANGKKMGITAPHQSASSSVNYTQNVDNEYFKQTLPDSILKTVNRSYGGQRLATYPQAGTSILDKDPLKNQTNAYGTSSIAGSSSKTSGS